MFDVTPSSVFELPCSLPPSCLIPPLAHTPISLIPSKKKKNNTIPSPCLVIMKNCMRRESNAYRDSSYPLPKCLQRAKLGAGTRSLD